MWYLTPPLARPAFLACLAALILIGTARSVQSEPPSPAMMAALKPLSALVGEWKGDGSSERNSGWKETTTITWGFRDRDGRVSFNCTFTGSPYWLAGILTFDPDKKEYRFICQDKKENVLRFAGTISAPGIIRLDRVLEQGSSTNDKLDRVEFRSLRGGDKLMIVVARRVGKTFFQTYASSELFREGQSEADFKDGPRCIVTGGAGRVSVMVKGETHHVACEACKEELLAHPERYLTK